MYNERNLVLWWKKTGGEIEKLNKYIEHCEKLFYFLKKVNPELIPFE